MACACKNKQKTTYEYDISYFHKPYETVSWVLISVDKTQISQSKQV
jgi:hypothetical protein